MVAGSAFHGPMAARLTDVTVRYGEVLAVDGVSVFFPPGAVGLLGRNGAGKSSVLKSLLGLVQPVAGTVQVLDLPTDAPPVAIRQRVGYMPERSAHIPGLNGYETVMMAGELTGLPRRDAARRAHETLYVVGLEEQRYRKVAGYSAGMRQKVKLACALVHDPAVLFLDEPTNGLDPDSRLTMLQVVGDLAQNLGKSVVLSTHILEDVERICDSVVLMEQGRVVAAGSLDELTRAEVQALQLEADGDPAAVEQALKDAGFRAVAPGMSPGMWRIEVAAEMPHSEVFRAVGRSGGYVRRLVEERRRLEDVVVDHLRGKGLPVPALPISEVGEVSR